MIKNTEQNSFYGIYYLCDLFYKWLDKDICAIFSSDVGKWNLMGIDSSEYDDIFPYYDGRARVLKKGKYGYIDRRGREVIPCQYRNAEDFHQGLALVEKFGPKELISKTGACVSVIEKGFVEKIPQGYRVNTTLPEKKYSRCHENIVFDKDIPLIIIGGRLLVKRNCTSIQKGLNEIDGTILLIEENHLMHIENEQDLACRFIQEKVKQKELVYPKQ